jgi:hypothetical protein
VHPPPTAIITAATTPTFKLRMIHVSLPNGSLDGDGPTHHRTGNHRRHPTQDPDDHIMTNP